MPRYRDRGAGFKILKSYIQKCIVPPPPPQYRVSNVPFQSQSCSAVPAALHARQRAGKAFEFHWFDSVLLFSFGILRGVQKSSCYLVLGVHTFVILALHRSIQPKA